MYHIYTHLSMLLSEEIRITTHMYIKKSAAVTAAPGRHQSAGGGMLMTPSVKISFAITAKHLVVRYAP